MRALVVIVVIIIIIIVFLYTSKESFATKRKKADSIVSWFAANPQGRYRDYKRDMDSPDIVDYLNANNLHNKKQLSVDHLSGVL